MAVVVDASALAAIAFGEPEGPTIQAHLEDETLLAPSLLDYELTSIAIKKVRKRPDELAEIAAGLHLAMTLPVTRLAIVPAAVYQLAQATGLSAYDASYLWLARSRDVELVTLDRALGRLAPT